MSTELQPLYDFLGRYLNKSISSVFSLLSSSSSSAVGVWCFFSFWLRLASLRFW